MSLGEPMQDKGERFDWPLFIATMAIATIGVVNLYSATSVYTGDRANLYQGQLSFLVAGAALASLVIIIDYRYVERWAYWIYGLTLISVGMVFVFAKGARGSERRIEIGGFGFQPSEFIKLALILALAKYFHDSPRSDHPKYLREFLIPAALTATPVALVFLQPDLGTSLIIGLIFLSIVALHRIRWQSLTLFSFVSAGGGYLVFTQLKGYQLARLTSFLDPDSDITGIGYHAHNARIAIGDGGVLGLGYMQGLQNKYSFLPDQYSDFPFPVFAEDWGFFGCVALIALYTFLVLWAVRIASQAKDRFGAVVSIGVGAMIFWHAFFNLGMVTGVLPVVGVPLPLFSYGGSSVLTLFIGLGLLMNISMRRPYLAPIRSSSVVFAR